MSGRDTRETVESEERFLYFDEAIDRFHSGECSYDEAVAEYLRHIGGTAIAGSAE